MAACYCLPKKLLKSAKLHAGAAPHAAASSCASADSDISSVIRLDLSRWLGRGMLVAVALKAFANRFTEPSQTSLVITGHLIGILGQGRRKARLAGERQAR
jgi:hypothetical protein